MTSPVHDAIKALRSAAQQAGGDLRQVHMSGAGVQTLIDELNVEEGRTIEPPGPGAQLPPGTDPGKVKYRPSNVVFLDDLPVWHDPT